MWKITSDLVASVAETLEDEQGRRFFERVWSMDGQRYLARLGLIGFEGYECVVDAGCGFGQWAIALAALNTRVIGVDTAFVRLRAARMICDQVGVTNITFLTRAMENTGIESGSVDAVFSYSAIYRTDYQETISEFRRILKPGGRLYVNTNDLGYYLHLLVNEPNKGPGNDPRRHAIRSMVNSIKYYATGRRNGEAAIIMPIELFKTALRENGFEIVASGPDGCCNLSEHPAVVPFYPQTYFGHTGVYEVVCVRR